MAWRGISRRALGQFRGLTPTPKSTYAKPNGATAGNNAAQPNDGEFHPSGQFLFVPHPGCCPMCHKLGLKPNFYPQPDVAFISHPNCLCSTIECPAEIVEQGMPAMIEWARHPYGRMRFGWSYGKALQTVDTTQDTAAGFRAQWERNVATGAWRRAEVTDADKRMVRDLVQQGRLGPSSPLTAKASRNAFKLRNQSPWVPQPAKGVKRTSVAPAVSKLRGSPTSARAALTRMGAGSPLGWMAVGALAKQAMDEAERKRRERERRKADYRRALGI